MKVTNYPRLNERLYEATLSNGLPVAVLPKPGFAKKSAYFVTNFGSIDTAFQWNGQSFRTPAGVAHYLEHKMFDLEGRDVMAEFSAMGANPNAFTSYALTAYYFSCTDNFEKCLELLLTLVSTPYFTAESVERERGIIGQEIGMYEDSADSQVYEDLFAAMYQSHPVRVPIVGSVESIGEITPQTLYDCYAAFYHPANMMLCVVGDVDPEAVVDMAERLLPGSPQALALRDYGPPEALTCPKPLVERAMDVAMPTFQLGFKCPWPGRGSPCLRQQIVGDLAAEALMGESSLLYLRLYRQGLIDSSFSAGYEDLPGVALLSCGGDSRDPDAVRDAILEEARRVSREGVEEDLFNRLKRSALGRQYRSLDSLDSTCFRLCAAHFDGVPYLEFPAAYDAVTREQVEDFIRQFAVEEHCALAVIRPRQEEVS